MDNTSTAVATEDFAELANARAGQILSLLREPALARWLRFWRRRPRDPELRKLLGRIHAAIRDAQRLTIEAPTTFGEIAQRRACDFLHVDAHFLGVDTALELIDCWDQLLIEHGDERHVRDLLAVELARDRIETAYTTWTKALGKPPPATAIDCVSSGRVFEPDSLVAVRNQLSAIYRARSTLYHLTRARTAMKALHLWLLAPVLLVLIIAFGVAIEASGGTCSSILLAGFAGSVGALLSGTFKLRDQIATINDLRAFAPALVVQPLIGATAGLFLLLVLESRLVTIIAPGEEWAMQGAAAFLAGFSEPFFLGIVKRVTEIGETSKAKKPGQEKMKEETA